MHVSDSALCHPWRSGQVKGADCSGFSQPGCVRAGGCRKSRLGVALPHQRPEYLEAGAMAAQDHVAFVLDLSPAPLPRCAEPPICGWLVKLQELRKAPVVWYWRPAA